MSGSLFGPVIDRMLALSRLARPLPPPDVPGLFRPTTRDEAVTRARRLCGSDGAAIRYRLADHSGGRDPHAPDCATHWRSPIKRIALATADCAGFVAWCLGFDRYQPENFAVFGGWLNCDSMLIDARSRQDWFEEVDWRNPDAAHRVRPLPGDLIVFPSIDIDRDGSRDRVGHVGVVIDVPPRWSGAFDELTVVHCSAGNDRRLGRAIAETSGAPWAGADMYRGKTNPRWAATFLRYRRFAPG